MGFVDELRKVTPPKKSVDQISFENAIKSMHMAVRSYCMKYKEQGSAIGYLMYSSEREYCQETYQAHSDLLIPYIREFPVANPNHNRHDKLRAYVNNEGCWDFTKPVADQKNTCDRYILPLTQKLQEDGFTNVKVETIPCYETYDEVKTKTGLFKVTYWKERVKTNNIWGYTIKFSVFW